MLAPTTTLPCVPSDSPSSWRESSRVCVSTDVAHPWTARPASGQHQMVPLAVEEPRADPLLEGADVGRDDGLRDVQLLRGAADPAEVDDEAEHLELVQGDSAVGA